MKSSTGILVGALALVAIGLAVAWKLLAAPEVPRPVDEGARTGTAERREGELAPESAPEDRVAASGAAPSEVVGLEEGSERTLAAEASIRVRGRVLDVAGAPIPAVAVGVQGKTEPLAVSDAFGIFELDLELEGRGKRLVAISEEWITIRFDLVQLGEPVREHVVLVAHPISLAGHVVDPTGKPIEGAEVAVRLPIAAFAGFPLALDSTGVTAPSTRSGPDGSFAIERAPSLARAVLETSSPGHEVDRRPLPQESANDLRIELREPVVAGAVLEGVVFHEAGTPAPGAIVHLDDGEAQTDDQGRFRLEIARVEEGTSLVATKKGFQAAVIPEFGRVIDAHDGHPPPVQLVLGPKALAISGRVLEADGKPCAGWSVAIHQGTAISQLRIPVVSAESITSGHTGPRTTDAQGAFVIEGLRGTHYVLQAWGRDGRLIRSDPIEAGAQGVELRCEPDAFVEKLRGRVVSRDGLPIAGAGVSATLVTFETSFGSAWETLRETRTGEDGRFELERVPKRNTRLNVDGDGVEATALAIDELDLERPVEIVVVRTCRFRFESGPGEEVPTHLEVLDAEGTSLDLVTREARSTMSGPRARLTDGRSHVLSVSESAARLVLYKGAEVLSSQPLRLAPGEIVTVRRAP